MRGSTGAQGRRRLRVVWIGLVTAILVVLSGLAVPFAQATPIGHRVDLRVLVVADGSENVEAIRDRLTIEGVPHTVVDLNAPGRPVINASFLSDTVATGPRAKFQAVVLPNATALPAAEMAALTAMETTFGIRRVYAYVFSGPEFGLRTPANPGFVGNLDGISAVVTPAGLAAGTGPFGYLDGPVAFENLSPTVNESFGSLATPLSPLPAGHSFTPLLTAPIPGTAPAVAGVLIGQYSHDQREELVITFAANHFQSQFHLVAHGIITWMTRGVHLGYNRSYFSLHIDDVLNETDRWSIDGNCTPNDTCPPGSTIETPNIRMTPADVDFLLNWQQANGIALEMWFNAARSDELVSETGVPDPLAVRLLQVKDQLRWGNHTYTHAFQGCLQDDSVVPWRCFLNANGSYQWKPLAEIVEDIDHNVDWANARGIPLDPGVLVTGEHSGLVWAPQQTVDSPRFIQAVTNLGIDVTASDASREFNRRLLSNGSTWTEPRYPMNIFYNVATYEEEVDEYNWIYNSVANGGSGICEQNANSTCIPPIPVSEAGFRNTIVPTEATIAMQHVLGNNPRSHYTHQGNLAEDRVVFGVLDEVLARYRAAFANNAPLVNPTMREIDGILGDHDAWKAALAANRASAYLLNGVVQVTVTGAALDVPITVPPNTRVGTVNGAVFGQAYGSEQSAWVPVTGGYTLVIPALVPATTSTTSTTTTTTTTTTTLPPATTTTPTTSTPPTTPVPGPPPDPQANPPAGYWMVGGSGSVYAFGGLSHLGNPTTVDAVDLEPTPTGQGYWIVNAAGTVYAFGDAPWLGNADLSSLVRGEQVSSISATRSGGGYWLFTSRGRVLPYGDAPFYGDMSGTPLNGPVLGSIPTASGLGYYMVASDGGIFSFGDAVFFGSMGSTPLNAPVEGLVPDADGIGYWLVASDGGIFAFDALFLGSMGAVKLNQPVIGMVGYGRGYLMVASDGGIFNFSDQPFYGSLGGNPPSMPIVNVAAGG